MNTKEEMLALCEFSSTFSVLEDRILRTEEGVFFNLEWLTPLPDPIRKLTDHEEYWAADISPDSLHQSFYRYYPRKTGIRFVRHFECDREGQPGLDREQFEATLNAFFDAIVNDQWPVWPDPEWDMTHAEANNYRNDVREALTNPKVRLWARWYLTARVTLGCCDAYDWRAMHSPVRCPGSYIKPRILSQTCRSETLTVSFKTEAYLAENAATELSIRHPSERIDCTIDNHATGSALKMSFLGGVCIETEPVFRTRTPPMTDA